MESLTVKRIKRLMQVRNLSAATIAEEIGISPSTLSLLLSGKNQYPRMDTLVGLARVLDTSVDYLAGTTDDPTPRAGTPIPDYMLEILDEMQQLDRSRSLELLRIVQAFSQAQRETASLRKTELVALLMDLAGDDAEMLASTLMALEDGHQGIS